MNGPVARLIPDENGEDSERNEQRRPVMAEIFFEDVEDESHGRGSVMTVCAQISLPFWPFLLLLVLPAPPVVPPQR